MNTIFESRTEDRAVPTERAKNRDAQEKIIQRKKTGNKNDITCDIVNISCKLVFKLT